MRNLAIMAMAGALALPATGAAAQELYAASILPGDSTWEVDGKPFLTLGKDAWKARDLAAGERRLTITGPDGQSVSETITFDEAQLASARGGRYWCIAVGAIEGKPMKILRMDRERCKAFIEAGH